MVVVLPGIPSGLGTVQCVFETACRDDDDDDDDGSTAVDGGGNGGYAAAAVCGDATTTTAAVVVECRCCGCGCPGAAWKKEEGGTVVVDG